jgi:hypothetical protein
MRMHPNFLTTGPVVQSTDGPTTALGEHQSIARAVVFLRDEFQGDIERGAMSIQTSGMHSLSDSLNVLQQRIANGSVEGGHQHFEQKDAASK